jgi:hypothetical protein
MKKGLLIAGAAMFAALSFATTNAAFADTYEEDDATDYAYEMATGGYRDIAEGLESGEYQGPGRLYGERADFDDDQDSYGYYDDDEDDDDEDDDE